MARIETENMLFGVFIAMLLGITGVMGYITYSKPPHPPDKTLVILIPATTDNRENQKRLSEAYAKVRPEIQIKPVEFPWNNIWQKLEFMIVANIPPDVSGIEQPYLPQFIYMGAVEPLDEWIKNDPDIDTSAFFQECMDEGNWDGVQWSIPADFSTVCLMYNKDLFDASGVAYPTKDWTKEQLFEAARTLTKDFNGDNIPDQWGFFTNNNHWNRYPPWIWMDGGEFMTADGRKSLFDSPKVVEGIRWLADLQVKYKVMPSSMLLGSFNADNLFLNGSMAMTTQTRYFLQNFFLEKNKDKIKQFRWDVCELPQGPAGRATTFVMGQHIIPRTVTPERKQMAWDYIKFLSSETGQETIASLNTAIAARRDVAYRMVDHPGLPPEHDIAFIDSLPYARYCYWPFPATEAFMMARSNLSSVWNGMATADEMCQKAAVGITKAMDDWYRLYPESQLPVHTKWVPFEKRAEAGGTAAVGAEQPEVAVNE